MLYRCTPSGAVSVVVSLAVAIALCCHTLYEYAITFFSFLFVCYRPPSNFRIFCDVYCTDSLGRVPYPTPPTPTSTTTLCSFYMFAFPRPLPQHRLVLYVYHRNSLGRASFVILEKLGHLEASLSQRFQAPSGCPRLFDLVQVSEER